MKKLIQWSLSSLRAKMLMMFVILTSIPLLIVGLISYQKSFNTISANSKVATMLVADQLARDIDVLFQDTNRLLELDKNPDVLKFLFSQTDSYDDAKQILLTIDIYRKTYKYDDVLNISMVNLYGRGISERKGVFALHQNPLRNPHFKHLMNHPDDILIIPPSDASTADRLDGFQYPQGNVISIIATVKQQITHEVIGFIVIDLSDELVNKFSENFTIGKTGYFYVTDETGTPIFAAPNLKREQLLSPDVLAPRLSTIKDSFVQSGASKPNFVIFTTSVETGWKVVGLAPLQEIVEDAHEIRQLIIFSVGLSILFIFGLYIFITKRLTRPIQVLKNKMRQAATGYLEAKVTPTGTDELADLGKSFNTMIENIKDLLEQSIREKEHIQKAELRTLQAQINPHFLYNTLDSIIWMAESGKNDQVIQLVLALSRFFRISLSKGRDWITIKEELEHVRNYLVIQQMRYRDILDYEISVDPSLDSFPILKMTLQPLVENAIYHGIKNKRSKGLIRITGHIENDRILIIRIEDNGIGMNENTLAQLQERLNSRQDEQKSSETIDGFGLYNVQQRVRLYYGSEFGLHITSIENQMTTIDVRFPVQRGEAT
ncbi:MAG: sensor histidine kinase [Candidatus Cohnella colombiensis]|uniref:Sensor histidine kinase n=1 Tax=Candidatus Cohnella colombiensis TaxID=3121368 RepID=A0AA95EWH9_9BACL|nr:MAG: sensor histidine kinase [Cohnella sp.]